MKKTVVMPVLFCTKKDQPWSLAIAKILEARRKPVLIGEVSDEPELIEGPSPDFVSVMLVDFPSVRHYSPYDPRDETAIAGLPAWALNGTWGAKIGLHSLRSIADARNCTLGLIDIFMRKQRKLSERRYPWGPRPMNSQRAILRP
jgi:hypothetical protein